MMVYMALRFFAVPARGCETVERELNSLLAGHKIVSVRKRFIERGENSYWAICVDYLGVASSDSATTNAVARNRVDYKSVLPAHEFAVYSQLRDLRKAIAGEESVPVYVLFSNEQLAQMVQRRCRNRSDLLEIEGLSEGKVDKYLERLMPVLASLEPKSDASGDTPF